MNYDDFSGKPPPRFLFPNGGLMGGIASKAKNLPKCPRCGTVMIVVEQVAAHCPECFYKQPYPWRIRDDDDQ